MTRRRCPNRMPGAFLTAAVALAPILTPLPPGLLAQAPPPETVVDLRIHGNHTMPDAEVLALAGVAVGDVVDQVAVDAITERLEASGRFQEVEVRKRYRSLTATDRIALIIVVRERPRASIRNPVVRSLARLAGQSMWLPVLRYDEGYGVSYGARFSLVDVLGEGSRVSVPATWGGDKRVTMEVERPLSRGSDRVRAGGSHGRRTHPYFGVEDRRTRAWVGFDRDLGNGLRAGAEAAWEDVGFVGPADRLTRLTVGLDFDGVSAGAFPRDDVKLRAAVERMGIAGRSGAVIRPRIDAQAFKGVGGQAVLAARFLFEGASAALPPYEKALLGGGGNLRGWRVGAKVGDRLAAASIELRLPLGSPISMGNAGVRFFYDTAAVYDAGRSLSDQRFVKGAGAGVFLTVPFGSLHLDAGHDFRGSVRIHAGAGLGF
ncbi:MAG: BamA/TamA family outer membrane protein [Acidobacteria bacterium]|nr:BamA/TamA family outer membrane protein [Acidobacteriota bacterium]